MRQDRLTIFRLAAGTCASQSRSEALSSFDAKIDAVVAMLQRTAYSEDWRGALAWAFLAKSATLVGFVRGI